MQLLEARRAAAAVMSSRPSANRQNSSHHHGQVLQEAEVDQNNISRDALTVHSLVQKACHETLAACFEAFINHHEKFINHKKTNLFPHV